MAILEAGRRAPSSAPRFQRCHERLRATRGAVLSLAVVRDGQPDVARRGQRRRRAPAVALRAPAEQLLVRAGVVGRQLPSLERPGSPRGAGRHADPRRRTASTSGFADDSRRRLGGPAVRPIGSSPVTPRAPTTRSSWSCAIKGGGGMRSDGRPGGTSSRAPSRSHLDRWEEAVLLSAYELGRRALDSGLGVLDVAGPAPRGALGRVRRRTNDPTGRASSPPRAGDFARVLVALRDGVPRASRRRTRRFAGSTTSWRSRRSASRASCTMRRGTSSPRCTWRSTVWGGTCRMRRPTSRVASRACSTASRSSSGGSPTSCGRRSWTISGSGPPSSSWPGVRGAQRPRVRPSRRSEGERLSRPASRPSSIASCRRP